MALLSCLNGSVLSIMDSIGSYSSWGIACDEMDVIELSGQEMYGYCGDLHGFIEQ